MHEDTDEEEFLEGEEAVEEEDVSMLNRKIALSQYENVINI